MSSIKVLIAGDYVPQNRVRKLIDDGKYRDVWGEVPSITEQYHYSILNLECPILSEGGVTPIKKTGPNLKCTSKNAIDAISFAHFSAVTLANNHFRDYGNEGVSSTISLLKDAGIDYVGGGNTLTEAGSYLTKEILGKRFVFINMCEREWSIASSANGGANQIDTISLFYQIQEAKKTSDYIIAIFHGGKELYNLPTPRMQKLYRYVIDLGADAVINHHQHCFSGYEIYKEKPIFYGIGNLCFDKGERHPKGWNYGFMVGLKFDEKISFELYPYDQCDITPGIHLLQDQRKFNNQLAELNSIINNSELLNKRYAEVITSSIPNVKSLLEPYWGRWIRGIVRKIGGPYLQTKQGYRYILANLQCETHQEIMFKSLNQILGI